MKSKAVFITFFILAMCVFVYAREDRGDSGSRAGNPGEQSRMDQQQRNDQNDNSRQGKGQDNQDSGSGARQEQAPQAPYINMSHPPSGGHDRNFPSQQAPARSQVQPPANDQPDYGRLNWQQSARGINRDNDRKSRGNEPAAGSHQSALPKGPAVSANNTKINIASAARKRPETGADVRRTLQKLGVKTPPGYIKDRAEIISTNRSHSVIDFPKKGFDNRDITSKPYSPREFNSKPVLDVMAQVHGREWAQRLRKYDETEKAPRHYYWHHERDLDFCHYIDDSGYKWYGWYSGNRCFWTRYFVNRWWWYDSDFDRWCFWNDGFWWWQDPFHMGNIYFYNGITYIPSNTEYDDVAVSVPDAAGRQAFTSPDGTRMVKVLGDTQDAFLYDTANPPAFNPVYLASGVVDVQFSGASNGRALQIMLKLNDNSFDMFDGDGHSYTPGNPPE